MGKLISSVVTLAAMAIAAPVSAATFAGNTTLADPTYNRVVSASTDLSGVGTAVHYQNVAFTVSTSGSYTFLMSAIEPVRWDTFLSLYSPGFVPTNAVTNLLTSNDDFGFIGESGFTYSLLAGTSYSAVAAGYRNTDVGSYALAINGPGTVTFGSTSAVPETATWAMMLAGFGMIGFAARRRASVTTTVRFA